jgi:hypothetical protein
MEIADLKEQTLSSLLHVLSELITRMDAQVGATGRAQMIEVMAAFGYEMKDEWTYGKIKGGD